MRSQLVWIFPPRSALHCLSCCRARRSRRKRLRLGQWDGRDIARARDWFCIISRDCRFQQCLHPAPHYRLLTRRKRVTLCSPSCCRSSCSSIPALTRGETETVRTGIRIIIHHNPMCMEVDPAFKAVCIIGFENVQRRSFEHDVARLPSAVPLSFFFEVTRVVRGPDLFQRAAPRTRQSTRSYTGNGGRSRDVLVLRTGRLHLMHFAPKPKSRRRRSCLLLLPAYSCTCTCTCGGGGGDSGSTEGRRFSIPPEKA